MRAVVRAWVRECMSACVHVHFLVYSNYEYIKLIVKKIHYPCATSECINLARCLRSFLKLLYQISETVTLSYSARNVGMS